MATNTTNYNWTKPDYEDDADIKDLNDNFDGIDAQVKAIDDQVQLNKNNISYNTNQGVKNLFNNVSTASSGNRVSYTPNADKSGTITTESTGAAAPVYFDLGSVTLPRGSYILSGGVSADVSLRDSANTYVDEGNGATITLSQTTTISLRIRVATGYTNTNGVTVYPMIRSAIISDITYQPYAMTNAELTAKEQTNETNISTLQTGKANVYGKFVANTTKSYAITNNNAYLLTVQSYNNWGIFLVFAYEAESDARINAVAKSADFDTYITVQANGKNVEIMPVSTAIWFISNLIRLGN